MSINASGSSTDTHLTPKLVCLFNKPSSSVFIAFTFTNVLLLFPLCILVVYHGFQRWRQQRASSTAASHSDSFTYHLVTMELVNVFGDILCCCGIYSNTFPLLMAWYCLFSIVWYGETLFHVVTCVEHYLAVVYPITYLSLRKEKGIRIRNIITGIIWLFCFGGTIATLQVINSSIPEIFLICSSVLITFFCSLSVLWALIHSGPGEQRRDQRKLTQTKQRAFYTILAILAALLIRFTSNLIWGMLSLSTGAAIECSWVVVGVWCNIPGSLVLPLLFLQRAGHLTPCANNTK